MAYLRPGRVRLDRANIIAALEASRRLRTDYVDLVHQIHWPDRPTNFFGQLGYQHPETDDSVSLETLEVLADLGQGRQGPSPWRVQRDPWGLMRYLALAEKHGLPRMVSIQNPYNLLNRSFEIGLAEVALREHCGLLAYSPLAFGVLSGKYLDRARPAGARLTLFGCFQRYSNPQAEGAAAEYVALARRHGLDPAQMALAWVTSRPFVTSNILGATSLAQLDADLASIDLELSAEVIDAIEAIHVRRTRRPDYVPPPPGGPADIG